MELDFKTVKALSSATRIRILSLVLKGDYSSTEISNKVDKSKSTVSSHLESLQNAGLVEKDKEDGRRRVLYSSTRKAEDIVEGKERKVKFSIASSAITGLGGMGLIAAEHLSLIGGSGETESGSAGTMGTMGTMDAGRTAAENASGGTEAVMYLGLVLILVSLVAASYGLAISKLK